MNSQQEEPNILKSSKEQLFPGKWKIREVNDHDFGFVVSGPGVNFCVWKDKEPWLYMFIEDLDAHTRSDKQ